MTTPTRAGGEPIRIGVSSCLLGREVRFDHGHKLDRFLADILAPYVEYVELCPEMGIGLSTPREPLRLVAIGGRAHMVGNQSGTDVTDRMEQWSERTARELVRLDLSGYVLKQDSPSCGMERVRLDDAATGIPAQWGVGLFARALMEAMPLLPIEEEGRLRDQPLRLGFIERVFSYRRLKDLFAGRWTVRQLVAFHSTVKLQLMAHEPKAYGELGRLVAGAKHMERARVVQRYSALYLGALAKPATVKRHVNVLQHIAGYFKTQLDPASHRELHDAIADFRAGVIPWIVPVTLLRHHARVHKVTYLAGQTYLEPSREELLLRNHG